MRSLPIRRLLLRLLAVLALAACSGDSLTEVDWAETAPLSGATAHGVAIVNGPGAFPLAVIDGSVIPADSRAYTLLVPVEYEDVAGQGYLEMWSVFADGGRYFSRTLAAEGGLAALTGSDSRTATLPFDLGEAAPPDWLELNIVLPGAGSVEIGPPRLVDGFTVSAAATTPWWSDAAGGWIGAILGTAIGGFGWWLGRRAGRRRDLPGTRRLAVAGIGVGAVLLAAGVVAVFADQPYGVYYPLLLAGGLTVIVLGTITVVLRRAMQDDELRQMRAVDLVS